MICRKLLELFHHALHLGPRLHDLIRDQIQFKVPVSAFFSAQLAILGTYRGTSLTKTHPPRTLLEAYAQVPRGVLGGWAFFYERGNPVPVYTFFREQLAILGTPDSTKPTPTIAKGVSN